ncbi:MAG: iron ABC transporter permease [Prevotella sp.]|nr:MULTISPECIES: iron ABC transporter permease [unclassified Prevotella]MCH3985377.1 iron ABC transporter permease [Prevotella sp.]MCH4017565.1 iron ABC transporter permease [Prevotella sp.]MCH4185747.1 iron ABC transporter permease [Prevotella sp.]MCI1323967.1 iron ABC transporter permease [Prevotella sp.]MCI1350094.1 iron ABC transporter permease [Prevotella sp.]
MSRGVKYCILAGILMLILFVLNLAVGSVKIPIGDVVRILSGNGQENDTWRFIIIDSRLPQAITATLAGSALAVSGLLLQSAFRNPLAGPDIFGINSGAGLAVAIVMLLMGGTVTAGSYSISGFLAVLSGAFIGAMAVTGIIFFFSTLVHSSVMLLIIGIMIGYLSSSAISLLNFFASDQGVKSYMVWGMGNFGNVSLQDLPVFVTVTLAGLLFSILLIKPLNAILLGEQYAENLGISTRKVRNWLLIVTGILTAVTTAFCGPIAFIGLATPHIARLILTTANHRQLLPATLLTGSIIALFCNMICCLPGDNGIIPLNAVTPLIGAPVIIYVIAKKR